MKSRWYSSSPQATRQARGKRLDISFSAKLEAFVCHVEICITPTSMQFDEKHDNYGIYPLLYATMENHRFLQALHIISDINIFFLKSYLY